ncbi:hypothetical protein TorRG33x02_152900 [Trema orientale]|uniref:Uncharacterized protein n=1 Tax=Trema orientale TaxID=63057 RepID=A0A2P5ETR8_TREOI|nr:hypothetical protein TorRG33x02_152900 [Trema orientale]
MSINGKAIQRDIDNDNGGLYSLTSGASARAAGAAASTAADALVRSGSHSSSPHSIGHVAGGPLAQRCRHPILIFHCYISP